jgi:outer membrane protein OmpA-like peptidoglycan-associated protein
VGGGECARCRARRLAGLDGPQPAGAALAPGGRALARAVAARRATEPGRCHYDPGERQASARSEGSFEQEVGVDTVTTLLFDFTPGSAELKSNHHVFIDEQIAQAGLADPNSDLEIERFVGFTDCVDTEGKNAPIRARRAEAVKLAYLDAGAAPDLIGPHEVAFAGPEPGLDATADGRARNRSVALTLVRRLRPWDPPKDCPECQADMDIPSDDWALESLGGAGLVPGAGPITLDFNLRNNKSGCVYQATFDGMARGGLAELSYDLGHSFQDFHGTQAMQPSEWNGEADARSVSLEFFEFGSIRLPNVSTQPARLDLGGFFNVGLGVDIGVWWADGTFTVRKCGQVGTLPEFASPTTTRLDPAA